MKKFALLLLIVFIIASCSMPQATNTPRIPDDVPTPAGCGDHVCKEPWENPFTCPEDCPKPTNQPSAVDTPAGNGSNPQGHAMKRPANPQIGLNFIRFYWSNRGNALDTSTPYLQPDVIFNDFRSLGVQTFRQFIKADLLWDVVEPQDNQWNFAQADVVLTNPDFEPIVTLFRLQYASPTPPWADSPEQFQKTLGADATDYLTTVVQRYAPYVKYWELGNEMVFWRAADPGSQVEKQAEGEQKIPVSYPLDGYSPQEQGIFLAQAVAVIRQYDPDAVILLPPLPSLDDYSMKTWLPGVVETGGKDWFDIVNYHYYPGWERYTIVRPQFQETLRQLGIDNKPVWLTETGATSNPNLTLRTNYPNSQESQAAEIFRRIVQAWGYGDALVQWHTYISSSDTSGNWSAYGIVNEKGQPQLSYYAFKLLTSELVPFARVEKISSDGKGVNAYKITAQAGAVKYVVWGIGDFMIPPGVTQMASVIPQADGSYSWQATQAGQVVALSANPVLVK